MVFTKKFYLSCIANVGFGFDVDCFAEKPSSFEEHAGRFFTVFVQPPQKFFLDVAQTFFAGLVGSTDTQEAFGTLRNPKMSSQELPE